MADVFFTGDAEELLCNKNIIFIGGSNIRALYKDLVWFLQSNSLVPQELLKTKLEDSFAGDERVRGDHLHRGRDYVEDRSYHHNMGDFSILVEYCFTSSCYSENIVEVFNGIKTGKIDPDVVIMNSTLWDINRWGPNGIDMYKKNMVNLMRLVSASIKPKCMFLWLTAPPVLSSILSSLFPSDISFLKPYVRFNVLEANNFARQIVGMYGHDVLDLHYYLRMQLFHIVKDGIHFHPVIERYITNLILTHCSLSWNVPLPGNVRNISLQKAIDLPFAPKDHNVEKYIDVQRMLEDLENMAPNKLKSSAPSKPTTQKSSNQNQNVIKTVIPGTSAKIGPTITAAMESNSTQPSPTVAAPTAAKPAKTAPNKNRVLVNSAKKKVFSKTGPKKKGKNGKGGSQLPTSSENLATARKEPSQPSPSENIAVAKKLLTSASEKITENLTALPPTSSGNSPVAKKGALLPTPTDNLAAKPNSADFSVEEPNLHSILSTKFRSWKDKKHWQRERSRPYPRGASRGALRGASQGVFRGNSILQRIKFQNLGYQAPQSQNPSYDRPEYEPWTPGHEPWRPEQPSEPFYLDPWIPGTSYSHR